MWQIHHCISVCFSYQFYIHIKADIIDGRLLCSAEQAVLFAAYAAQGLALYQMHSDLLQCLVYLA